MLGYAPGGADLSDYTPVFSSHLALLNGLGTQIGSEHKAKVVDAAQANAASGQLHARLQATR